MRLLYLFLLSSTVLSAYVACLQCVASTRPWIKGQYLYASSVEKRQYKTVTIPVMPGVTSYHQKTVQREFSTNGHGNWNIAIIADENNAASANIIIKSGEKWTIHYIVTIYYTDPSIGIATADYYIDFPDTCNFHSSAITADNVLYVEVFQRADVAITQQLCKAANVVPMQMQNVGIFANNDFRHNDLLYTEDRRFTARHTFQRPFVQLSVVASQTEWSSYVFFIPRDGLAPLKYWLRSGESCYYILMPDKIPLQEVISVYV